MISSSELKPSALRKTLARNFRSMDALSNADKESLTEIHEIGDRIAESVIEWFSDTTNLDLVGRLSKHGLNMQIREDENASPQKLQGLSFVISGTYEGYSRDEVKSIVEQHGGKNTSSISSETDYLIAGANAGPSKIEKANKLGVSIIELQEFLNLIK